MTLDDRLTDLFAADTAHLPTTGPGINVTLQPVQTQGPPRRLHMAFVASVLAASVSAAVVALLVLANRPNNSPTHIVSSTIDTQTPTTPSIATTTQPTTLAVGDEVMLGAKQRLVLAGVSVDAAASRFADDTRTALEQFFSSTVPLPDVVVIQMGTNGPTSKLQYEALLDIVGNRRVIMLTVHAERDWTAKNNYVIRNLPAEHPNVEVADWDAIAGDHPDWFTPDGLHLTDPAGTVAYTNIILSAIAKR